MPVALATTKRKFHKLLDSISNASSTSLATTTHDRSNTNASTTTLPNNFDPPAKRTRLADRPMSAFAPSASQRLSTPTRQSFRPSLHSTTPTSAKSVNNAERKVPNFAPWDREQFLQRLKTFRHVDKWMSKPDRINEVEWAKRGWSCTGKETVRCLGGCEKEVVVKLERDVSDKAHSEGEAVAEAEEDEDDWREEAQKLLVGKYAEMISSAHEGGCLWRRRGCDDTIQRLPITHQKDALAGLHHRYISLTAMAASLPSHISMPSDLDTAELSALALPILHPTSKPKTPPPTTNDPSQHPTTPPAHPNPSPPLPTENPTINTPALLLALTGWQAEEEGHVPGLATCPACFRRLGLWLFKPAQPSSSTTSTTSPDDQPPSSPMTRLDPITEHRDYCPWINILSQNGGAKRTSLDGLSGWEVCVRAVRVVGGRELEKKGKGGVEVGVDGVREGEGVGGGMMTEEETKVRERKDEERWARLKRLKAVFGVRRKGVGTAGAGGKKGGG